MKNILCLLVLAFSMNGCSHTKTFDPFSCDVFADAMEPMSHLRFVTCMETEIPKFCQKFIDSGNEDNKIACFGVEQVTCKKKALLREIDILEKYIECINAKADKPIF